MSASCCESKIPELEKLAHEQKRVLWTVLVINLFMFFVEFASGAFAHSVALMGDSLDMLGDSLAYGASLYVIHKSLTAKARSAIFKGWIIIILALFVLGSSIYRTFFQQVPTYEIMGVVGFMALSANILCLVLLTRFRHTDVNMSSVWICSRNDIIANTSVLIAAFMVRATNTPWPDLIVGTALSLFFAKSALYIFSESKKELAKQTVTNLQ